MVASCLKTDWSWVQDQLLFHEYMPLLKISYQENDQHIKEFPNYRKGQIQGLYFLKQLKPWNKKILLKTKLSYTLNTSLSLIYYEASTNWNILRSWAWSFRKFHCRRLQLWSHYQSIERLNKIPSSSEQALGLQVITMTLGLIVEFWCYGYH